MEKSEVAAIRPNAIIEVHKKVFEGLEITRACLHQAVQVPNGGGTTAAFYSKPGSGIGGSATTGVKMTYNSEGLWCVYKGTAFVVPLANVSVCFL